MIMYILIIGIKDNIQYKVEIIRSKKFYITKVDNFLIIYLVITFNTKIKIF
jgi:hypothetical protein